MNRQLTALEKDLLLMSAKKLIDIVDNEDCINVTEVAFGYYSDINGNNYQVQLVVTRDESEFIDLLSVVETVK